MPTQKAPRTRPQPKPVPQHLRSLTIGPNELQRGALHFFYARLSLEVDMLSPAERISLVSRLVSVARPDEIEAYAEVIGNRVPSKLGSAR